MGHHSSSRLNLGADLDGLLWPTLSWQLEPKLAKTALEEPLQVYGKPLQ